MTVPAAAPDPPRLRPGVRVHLDPVTGQTVLLYPEGVLTLNATAAAVLKLCDGRTGVDAIAGALGAQFAGSPDQIRRDIAVLLDRLRQRRLLA